MSMYGHLETIPRTVATGSPRHYVRPGAFLSKVANPIVLALGRKTVLVVRGRTSGKLLKVPMDPPFAWNGTATSSRPAARRTGRGTFARPGKRTCAHDAGSSTSASSRSTAPSATRS
jgi:hypothetical protein